MSLILRVLQTLPIHTLPTDRMSGSPPSTEAPLNAQWYCIDVVTNLFASNCHVEGVGLNMIVNRVTCVTRSARDVMLVIRHDLRTMCGLATMS